MSELEEVSQGCFFIRGDLDMDSIAPLRDKGIELISRGPSKIDIDLSEAHIKGSPAIALFLSWLKFAAEINKELSFSHPGEKLLLIAKATGVGDILNFKES